jgi:hypothetical protein
MGSLEAIRSVKSFSIASGGRAGFAEMSGMGWFTEYGLSAFRALAGCCPRSEKRLE